MAWCDYTFEQEPKAQDQLEDSHRRIEYVVVNDFVEVRENEKNESAEYAPGRRDDTESSQASWDVTGLKPQIAANRRC